MITVKCDFCRMRCGCGDIESITVVDAMRPMPTGPLVRSDRKYDACHVCRDKVYTMLEEMRTREGVEK